MKTITNQRGGVLLACVIITLLIMTVIVQFSNWNSQMTQDNLKQLARQKALVNADTGVQAAYQFLRSPQGAQLDPGETIPLPHLTQGSTFYVSLTRQLADSTLIDIFSTGYYQIPQGAFTDPSGQRAQQAVVRAQVQLRSIGDYFAATPGTLDVAYNSNISSGIVYGRDLRFTSGNPALNPPGTRVMAAYYFNSVTPSNYADFVTFLNAPFSATQMGVEPNLPTLGPGMRNEYQLMAPSDVLPNGTSLSGLVPPPANNAYKVYFGAGEVHLGVVGSSCTLQSSFLIYALGDIIIHNVINGQLGDAAWPALLTEGNIYIATDAPNNMQIDATLIAAGEIKALGGARPNSELVIKGGLIAGEGINFATAYTQRTFTYQAPDPNLPLPSSTSVTMYKVTQGKFNR
jgi:hypothetical protein